MYQQLKIILLVMASLLLSTKAVAGEITPVATWNDTITIIEKTDPLEGGVDGIDNRPHIELAQNIAFVNDKADDIAANYLPLTSLNNTLTSTSAKEALTATKGRALNEKIVALTQDSNAADADIKANYLPLTSLNNTLTSTATNQALTANMGRVLSNKVANESSNRINAIDNIETNYLPNSRLNNTLTSTATNEALTAAQGNVLKNKIDNETTLRQQNDDAIRTNFLKLTAVNNTLTSTATNQALTANMGRVLNEKVGANTLVLTNGFANKKATNGYTKLPNGIIMQWGTVDYTRNPGEREEILTFPAPFPTAVLNFQATRKISAQSHDNADGGVLIYSLNKTTAVLSLQHFDGSYSGLRGFTWFAIGY